MTPPIASCDLIHMVSSQWSEVIYLRSLYSHCGVGVLLHQWYLFSTHDTQTSLGHGHLIYTLSQSVL